MKRCTSTRTRDIIAARQLEIRLLRPLDSNPEVMTEIYKRLNAIVRLRGYGSSIRGYEPDPWMLR